MTRRDLHPCLIGSGCNATLQGASSVRPVVVTAGVVVGRVIESRRHPNADRLWVATVDVGDRKLTIVHGGTRYRGLSSQGMLCSTDELGWTTDGPDAVHVLDHGEPGEVVMTRGTRSGST